MAAELKPGEQEAIDAVQAEKAALGIPDEPSLEEEKTQDAEDKDKSDENKDSKKEEVDEDDSEDTDEKDSDEDDSDKDDESEEDDDTPLEQVPKKTFKEYKENLKVELQKDFDQKLENMRKELTKGKPDEEKVEDLEAEIESLAKELDFDPSKVRRIIQVARKGLDNDKNKEALSPEDKKVLEEFKQQKFMNEQKEIFDTQWNTVIGDIKKSFPNATDEQIKTAQKEMDKLCHTEKYHTYDMDAILFKEKAKFDKILFSPKQKTFESGRPAHTEQDENDVSVPDNIADMTPAQFAAFEKRRDAAYDQSPRTKVRITTRDDRGNVIEREE
jgi:hypothetical protein